MWCVWESGFLLSGTKLTRFFIRPRRMSYLRRSPNHMLIIPHLHDYVKRFGRSFFAFWLLFCTNAGFCAMIQHVQFAHTFHDQVYHAHAPPLTRCTVWPLAPLHVPCTSLYAFTRLLAGRVLAACTRRGVRPLAGRVACPQSLLCTRPPAAMRLTA